MEIRGKKVLVTGADGFIGSHLVETLLGRSCQVRALSQYNHRNHWGWLEDIHVNDNLEIVTGDIRDAAFCRELVAGVDVVFHLAALIAIPYSYKAPSSYIDTNVKGTLNLCHAAKEMGGKRFIHVSTSEVYGSAQYVPIDEAHPLQPQSPYSASKIGAESIAHSYFYSFGLEVIIARPFNTYGPRQSARAFIPTVITQLLSGKEVLQLGDLRPTRDFTFVIDTCRALLSLGECDAAVGEIVNIGMGEEISMEKLYHLICDKMDLNPSLEIDLNRIRPQNSEVKRLLCDPSKLKHLTGFEAEISLEIGIETTIDWFKSKSHKDLFKADIYNV